MSAATPLHRMRNIAIAGVSTIAILAGVGSASYTMVANAETAPSVQTQSALPSYADIVAKAKPAVVTVTATMAPENVALRGDAPQMPGGTPFDQFFQQFFNQQQGGGGMPPGFPQMQPNGPQGGPQGRSGGMALGSGFIVSPDGTIVTNNHVVDGATKITVTLDDGREMDATLVGTDAKNDIAVLKVSAKGDLPVVPWGNSDALRLGDPVVAIGNPFGIGTTVTSGIVSARGRDLHNGPYDDFIQVDAAINHGNSGGPLLDASGAVIGINSAIFSPNGGNVGVGFAIPSAQAEHVVAMIEEHGSIQHGFIGVRIQKVDADIAGSLGLKEDKGALIASVNDGSPAAEAGLVSGDVILAVNDKAVDTPKDLSRMVADLSPDAKATLKVWRNGAQTDLKITVGKIDDGSATTAQAEPAKGVVIKELGLTIAAANPEIDQQFGLDPETNGVVVTALDAKGSAADKGLAVGDVILGVGQTTVTTAKELQTALADVKAKGRDAALLQVSRNADKTFVAVPFSAS